MSSSAESSTLCLDDRRPKGQGGTASLYSFPPMSKKRWRPTEKARGWELSARTAATRLTCCVAADESLTFSASQA